MKSVVGCRTSMPQTRRYIKTFLGLSIVSIYDFVNRMNLVWKMRILIQHDSRKKLKRHSYLYPINADPNVSI